MSVAGSTVGTVAAHAPDTEEEVTDGSTEEQEYTCEECGKSYDSENGLAVHKGRSHSD